MNRNRDVTVNVNAPAKKKPSSPITGKGTPHNRHRFPSNVSPKSQTLFPLLFLWVKLNTPPNPFPPPFPWVRGSNTLFVLPTENGTEPCASVLYCTLHPLSHPVPAYLPQQRVNVRVSVRAGGGCEKLIQVPATERGNSDVHP